MARQHFVFLDGLRGIAALMVGCFHICNLCLPMQGYLSHSYLAVDFFFCLSGLVLAQAYDQRLGTRVSSLEFFKRRLIRLWPMIMVGAALSVVALFFLTNMPVWGVVLFGLGNLFLLPLGLAWPVSGGALGEAYPGNNPLWSLFFECLASVLFGLGMGSGVKSRKSALLVLSFLAVMLIIVIFKDATLGRIGFFTPEAFAHGTIRVLFSLACGVFIFRLRLLDEAPAVPQWLIVLVLIGVFAIPKLRFDYVVDILAVLIILPMIVLLGAASQGAASRLWSLLGRLSYPFYLVHMPVVLLMNAYLAPAALNPYAKAALIMLMALGVSYAFMVFYDEPVRGWLMSRRRKPASAEMPAP